MSGNGCVYQQGPERPTAFSPASPASWSPPPPVSKHPPSLSARLSPGREFIFWGIFWTDLWRGRTCTSSTLLRVCSRKQARRTAQQFSPRWVVAECVG